MPFISSTANSETASFSMNNVPRICVYHWLCNFAHDFSNILEIEPIDAIGNQTSMQSIFHFAIFFISSRIKLKKKYINARPITMHDQTKNFIWASGYFWWVIGFFPTLSLFKSYKFRARINKQKQFYRKW